MPLLPPLTRSGRRKLTDAVRVDSPVDIPDGHATHGEASVRRDRAGVQSALDENASRAAGRLLSRMMSRRGRVIQNMEQLIRAHHRATDAARSARTYREELNTAGLGGELSPAMNPILATTLLTIFALIEMVAFHNALLLGFGLSDEGWLAQLESWLFALLSISVVFLGTHSGRHARYAVQRLTLARRLRSRGADRMATATAPTGSTPQARTSALSMTDTAADADDPSDSDARAHGEFNAASLRAEARWDILHWIGAGIAALGIIYASAELRRFGLQGTGLPQPAPIVFILISSAALMASWVVEYSAANHWFKSANGLDRQARAAEKKMEKAGRREAKATGKFDRIRAALFATLSVAGARAGYEGEIAEQIVHEGRGALLFDKPWHPMHRERIGIVFLPGVARLIAPYDPSDLSPDLMWQIAADRAGSPYSDAFLRRKIKTVADGSGTEVEAIVPMQPTAQRLLWPVSMAAPAGLETSEP